MDIPHLALGLLAAAALANVAASAKEKKCRSVVYATKPLLMPLLVLYHLTAAGAPDAWLVAALACGWAGDVLLMLPGEKEAFFLGGLGAFLLNQVLYVAIFLSGMGPATHIPGWLWWLAAPYLLFGAAYFGLLVPRLGRLRVPVAVYMAVILAMGISALLRFPFAEGASYRAVLSGSLLFIASDGILAYDRFVRPFAAARALVMATYVAAQFLITWGLTG